MEVMDGYAHLRRHSCLYSSPFHSCYSTFISNEGGKGEGGGVRGLGGMFFHLFFELYFEHVGVLKCVFD